jgi:hypothetical protein
MAARAIGFWGARSGFGARYEGIVIASVKRAPFGEFMVERG